MIPLPSYSMIADLLKKGATLEAQEQIMKLREAALELQEENLMLRDENKKLREATDISARLRRHGNCYYLDDDSAEEHPYCLTCWDSDRKLVSLLLTTDHRGTHIRCGVCAARAK